MKTIQTVITAAEQIDTQLGAGAAFARAHDAHLDVLCVGMDHSDMAYGPTGGYVSLVQVGVAQAKELVQSLHGAVTRRMAEESQTMRWTADEMIALGGTVGLVLRPRLQLADLVILQRPSEGPRSGDAIAVLEGALLDARAPVLVVSASHDLAAAAAPRRVLLAWNRSNEAMAAIRAAMPLLKQAEEVCIAVVDPGTLTGEQVEPGHHLSTVLSRHGIKVSVAVLPRALPAVGDVLARQATDFGADLLVMGAYGHSRLREALFGGATRDMLDHCPVPVLLVH